MRRFRFWWIFIIILIIFWLTLPPKLSENWSSGEVVRIVDGDTLFFIKDGKEIEARLMGIDAPEYGEKFALEATNFLASKLSVGSTVFYTQETPQTDVYGRQLIHAYHQPNLSFSESVNARLVAAGLAMVPDYRDKTIYFQELKEIEKEAQKNKLGIHGDT